MKQKVIGHEQIKNIIKPEFIYIPLTDINNQNYKSVVKEGDYVSKNSIIGTNKDKSFNIYSPISGYVRKNIYKTISSGEVVECLTIENDFKEKYLRRSKTTPSYSENKFIKKLSKYGISSNFNDLPKYNPPKIKHLLVNTISFEPFVTCSEVLINNFCEEILWTIDYICEVLNISKAIIALGDDKRNLYTNISNHIGTYPNISIRKIKEERPIALEIKLINKIFGVRYKNSPLEKGIITTDISILYAIFEMLKYDKPLTEKIITITNPIIKESYNIKVKIGTSVSEIIDKLNLYRKLKKPMLIMDGLFKGKSVSTDDVIITSDINSVTLIENHYQKRLPCINCGKCIKVCPVFILPALIIKNKDNINRVQKLEIDKCIGCGLCSYICPSKIEVREILMSIREKVKEK